MSVEVDPNVVVLVRLGSGADLETTTLRYARLVPAWVTVNHLGAEPGT